MLVLEVNGLVDVLGQAEDLVARVDHVLILDEVIERIDVWRAIEQNGSSIGFEVGVGLALAASLPGVLQLDHLLLPRPKAHVFLLSLDESLEIVLDVGELCLHVGVQGFVVRVLYGLERSSPLVFLRRRVFLSLEGVALAGEGDRIGGVVLLCSFHSNSKIV